MLHFPCIIILIWYTYSIDPIKTAICIVLSYKIMNEENQQFIANGPIEMDP